MGVFQQVNLAWDDKKFVVPSNNVLRLVASVESEITLFELADLTRRGAVPTARLSLAYASALRHAGAIVTDLEVADKLRRDPDRAAEVALEIIGILKLMSPPSDMNQSMVAAPGVLAEGNVQ